jgi:mono/diheme cytochrome c family protein
VSRGRIVTAGAATALAFVATLGLVAGHGRATGADAAKPTYFEDVKPILDGRCAGCHFRGGIGPFALTSYRDAYTHRAEIAAAVARRIMPPWHAEPGHQRYRHDPSLTDAQIATIRRWVAQGAARGSPARPAPRLEPVGARLSRVDLRLPLPTPYTPKRSSAGDDYRCFVLPWTAAEPRYVTGFNVTPGTRRQVHHIIVYLAGPTDVAPVEAWDAADPAPGYRCYGGPSGPGGGTLAVQLLAGWAPGSSGSDLPSGTGIRVLPGSRLIVQVHYNLDHAPHGAARPDRSVVELKVDPTVERRGLYLPVVDVRWLLARNTFTIPAGRKRVVHSFLGDPQRILPYLAGDVDMSGGFLVHSALLHMHRLGERGRVGIERASGQREVLLAVRRWDFDWQRDYALEQPATVVPGDRLWLTCQHDNSRANQPLVRGRRQQPRTVTWGEDSSDEMCIAFLYVSQR